jgi:hypothetical protein
MYFQQLNCIDIRDQRGCNDLFMHVTAIHRIHDPAGFQKAEDQLLEKGIPAEFKLLIHAATSVGRLTDCILSELC